MSKRRRRRTRVSREDRPTPMPTYNFPNRISLLMVIVALVLMVTFGTIVASSDVVQDAAHIETQEAQP